MSTANDLTQTFAYNPASQITSLTRSNNLYAWTGHYNENVSSTANGLNQIGNVGAKTVTHDTKGNITAVGADSYGYNSENFLTSGPASTTLSYDPMGRLYQVTSGASTTRLGYDGLDRIAEYNASNAIQRRYLHGPGVDEPIVWYEGSGITTRRFLSSDERGSIIAVTDSSGTVLGLNKYDEYGVPQSSNLGKFGYTGQVWVPEVGLWYFKARFLRPDIGRFLQTDPLGYSDSPNLYAYVGNDPIGYIDPAGTTVVGNCDLDGGCPISGVGGIWFNEIKEKGGSDEEPIVITAIRRISQGAVSVGKSAANFGLSASNFGLSVSHAAVNFSNSVAVQAVTWVGGGPKITPKIAKQMKPRGWTKKSMVRAMLTGEQIRARNKLTGGPATRYIDPKTGQSLVVDDTTGEVIQVGGPGFSFGPVSGDVGP